MQGGVPNSPPPDGASVLTQLRPTNLWYSRSYRRRSAQQHRREPPMGQPRPAVTQCQEAPWMHLPLPRRHNTHSYSNVRETMDCKHLEGPCVLSPRPIRYAGGGRRLLQRCRGAPVRSLLCTPEFSPCFTDMSGRAKWFTQSPMNHGKQEHSPRSQWESNPPSYAVRAGWPSMTPVPTTLLSEAHAGTRTRTWARWMRSRPRYRWYGPLIFAPISSTGFSPEPRSAGFSCSASVVMRLLKWVGAKQRLLPQLIPLLPREFNAYHEPFAGSAALFFALGLSGKRVHLNDVTAAVAVLYRVIQHQAQELKDMLAAMAAEYTAGARAERPTLTLSNRNTTSALLTRSWRGCLSS